MNLGDLFNDNSNVVERPGAGGRKPAQSFASRPEYSESSSSRPPAHRTPSMEYYGNFEGPVSPQMQQRQQQQQQQYYYGRSPQQSGSPNSVAANPNQNQFQTPDQEHPSSGLSLDFLDFDASGADGQMALGSDENAEYNLQAMPSLGHGVGHSVGIDLGFGMAVDFQHDWSENANYDILEGYFFGGSGPGTSGD